MKTPEPKYKVVEQGHQARQVLAEVAAAHHPDLDVTHDFEMLWVLAPRYRKGRRVLGTCKVQGEDDFRLSGVAVVIKLDREWWEAADSDAQHYLCDHELSHVKRRMEEVLTEHEFERRPATATDGRPLYESVGHEIEDFAGPIQRWGVQPDLENFLERAGIHPDLTFEPAEERLALRAVS